MNYYTDLNLLFSFNMLVPEGDKRSESHLPRIVWLLCSFLWVFQARGSDTMILRYDQLGPGAKQ